MPKRIDYLNDPNAPAANSIVPSVNVIIVNERDEMLMICRTDNGNWAVPGGAMDFGESIAEAAVRETREETGIECEITGLVGIYTNPRHVIRYTSNDEVRQEFSIVFTARPLAGKPTPSSESSEVSGYRSMPCPGCKCTRPCVSAFSISWTTDPSHTSADSPAAPQPGLPWRESPAQPAQRSESPGRRDRSVPDLHKAVRDLDVLPVRTRRHIAIAQAIGQQRISRRELRRKNRTKAAHVSLDISA